MKDMMKEITEFTTLLSFMTPISKDIEEVSRLILELLWLPILLLMVNMKF